MHTNFSLKGAILESGLKQYILARKARVDSTRLSKIIHGHVSPSDEEKESISKTLGRTAEELFQQSPK